MTATLSSADQTTTVSYHGSDTPPVLSNVGIRSPMRAGATATTLSSGSHGERLDKHHLASGSVSITSGLLAGDTLAASTTGTSITASYSASTGVLSLTGSDTLAHYQQVLDSVTYASTSQNPTNSGADPSRTVSWVSTTARSPAPRAATINITAVNDAPVATIVPTTYSAAGSLNLKNTGMSVSDIDSLGGVETVRLSVTEGTLTVTAGTSGAAVSGNGASTVTITGTLARRSMHYSTPTPPAPSAISTTSARRRPARR